MTPSISVSHLSKVFRGGVAALDDVSLDVPPASVFGFLGPNGAGKTTALRIMAGLARPTSGAVRVGGIPLDAGIAYRRHIGYLAQEPRFYGWMSGRETLRYVAGFYPWLDRPARIIDRLLDDAGLSGAANRRTGEYSAGMRQRLGIAQALVGDPSVLLLDEPVSALDPMGRREVLDLLHRLGGTPTVFYSTHILGDIERIADHVAILHRGRLIAAAPTAELLAGSRRGALRVELVGGGPELIDRLRRIDGVVEVVAESGPATGSRSTQAFTVTVGEAGVDGVQAALTRFAAQAGLAVAQSRPITLDLESIFLGLVAEHDAESVA